MVATEGWLVPLMPIMVDIAMESYPSIKRADDDSRATHRYRYSIPAGIGVIAHGAAFESRYTHSVTTRAGMTLM
jgi:hypothetical protein